MKKSIVLLLIILSISSLNVSAATRTIYYDGEPEEIKTSLGFGTDLIFDVKIQDAWTPNKDYKLNYNKGKYKVIITPQQRGIITNLNVADQNGNEYTFILKEIESDRIKDIDLKVFVKPQENVDYDEIINIMKEERITNNSLKEMLQIYEIDSKEINVNNFRFNLKKVALFDNINRAIYWLRAVNTGKINQVIKSLEIEGIKIESVGIEGDKNNIKPNNYIDLFIFVNKFSIQNEKGELIKDLKFNFTTNRKSFNIKYDPVNYKRKMFQIYDFGN